MARKAEALEVCRVANPEFGSWAYLVIGLGMREAMIIDPGSADTAALFQCVASKGIARVPFLIVTHEHFDHVAGLQGTRDRYQSVVVCSSACAARMADPKLNMSHYKGQPTSVGPADWVCEDRGWEVPWSAGPVRLFSSPGHSPGGVCVAVGDLLFSGDTLLGNQRTPTHLPGGDKSALRRSIGRIFSEFGPETTVYPGHGDSFALGQVDPRVVLGDVV
jgi:hydroxyacylglutathione hydrolase